MRRYVGSRDLDEAREQLRKDSRRLDWRYDTSGQLKRVARNFYESGKRFLFAFGYSIK